MKLFRDYKIPILDYLFVFVLIIYGGNASLFTREYGSFLNISTYIPLLFSFIIALRHRVRIQRQFIIGLGLFWVYFLAASVVNGYMSLSFISYWSITLVISYFTCVSLGKNYFIAFEHVVVFLSIIGLILWGAYLLSPDTVMRVIKLLRFSNWYEDGRTDVINIVVFTLLDKPNTDLGFYLFLLLSDKNRN